MIKPIVNYFDEERAYQLSLRVGQEKQGAYFHEGLFPLSETAELNWKTMATNITNVAAMVQNFNAKAPVIKRDGFDSIKGEILPITHSYNLNESMMLNINNPRYKNIVLNAIVNDAVNSYNAIRARLAFIAMKQLSTGKVTYDANNNNGGVVSTFIDYQLEDWQTQTVSVSWATAASATPLKDIRDWTLYLNDKGYYPNVIRMSRTAFNYMINTTEVKSTFGIKVTKGDIESQFLSVADMNVFLNSKELPIIEIVKDDISYIKEDGSFDPTRRAWTTDAVQFGYSNEGDTLWVTPLEYSQRADMNAYVNLVNGVAIQQYSELNPPSFITMAKSIALPVWNNSFKTLILTTTQA